MSGDRLPFELPESTGPEGAITFVKNGHEFRVLRFDREAWVIHSSGKLEDEFQLIVEPYGDAWTLRGTNGIVFVDAMGVSLAEIFGDKFF